MRQHLPALLRVTAGLFWGGTFTADAENVHVRIWAYLLTGAAVTTLAALFQLVLARSSRVYEGLARAVLSRPLNQTGPLAVLTRQAVPEQAGPLARLSAHRKPRGLHSIR